jgi:hypothetical protein
LNKVFEVSSNFGKEFGSNFNFSFKETEEGIFYTFGSALQQGQRLVLVRIAENIVHTAGSALNHSSLVPRRDLIQAGRLIVGQTGIR